MTHPILDQAAAILADPEAHPDRPLLRRLAALIVLSAAGQTPRQRHRAGAAA